MRFKGFSTTLKDILSKFKDLKTGKIFENGTDFALLEIIIEKLKIFQIFHAHGFEIGTF